MLKNAKSIAKGFAIVMIFMICFLSHSCTPYDPTLYPSYDVLNPGPEVTINPIAWIKDGRIEDRDHNEIYIMDGTVVNEAFMLWVYELKEEVEKLRK